MQTEPKSAIDTLTEEYGAYLTENNLPSGCALELVMGYDGLTKAQMTWLQDFIVRWDAADRHDPEFFDKQTTVEAEAMTNQVEIEFGTLPTITKAVIEKGYRVPIFNDGTLRWNINDEATGKGICAISFPDAADHKHPQFEAYKEFQRRRAQQIAELINLGLQVKA